MNILFAASECVPFVKTGGLADVVGSLAQVLARKGHDIRVVTPMYTAISRLWQDEMKFLLHFDVQLGWRRQYCGVHMLHKEGVTYYFLDNKYYFGRPYIYGLGGDEYERFGFFCRAVLDALPLLDFHPDILHCHDWQTGMVPALQKIQYAHLPFYSGIKSLYTIHNLQYQGIFGIKEVQDVLGLGDGLWTADKLECYGCANFMKAGLVYGDVISTVSPSYAQEITTTYFGERLDGLIRARQDFLYGVLNGIDVVEYDPEKDPLIYANYGKSDLAGKAENKRRLQQDLGLDENADMPLIAMVGRLTNQKGLDLVDRVLVDFMGEEVQLAVLGMGDAHYTNLFSWAEQKYHGKLAARFAMDHELAHKLYAASDYFLMPSLFEPCGLSQMMAMRYGSVPIVRETGGLRDTVLSYNEFTGDGNGFTFMNYNAHDMLAVIRRALYCFHKKKEVVKVLQARGMEGDFSWDHSAEEYLGIYQKLSGERKPADNRLKK
ncbi:MAG: glycogen synthase GlgA [Clostridia bacterium]|nr:glycogen synthase GlgA [Clostridia bacterium]